MPTPTTPRRRSKWLRCIPPADVLRRQLRETETEAAQLRELLATAERIDAAETTSEAPQVGEAAHG